MNESVSCFEAHIDVSDASLSAIDIFSSHTDLSRQQIKQAMNKGAVWLTRGKYTSRLRRATKKLQNDDTLHLYYDEKVLSSEPAKAQLIADEGAYSIWYKPCGMLSQGSKWGDHCAINRWAEKHLKPERPAFVVHRLDRAATGLIMIAHEKKVSTLLSSLFQEREVEKHYHVIVHGKFPKHEMHLDKDIDGKQAISHAKRIDFDPEKNLSLLDVSIETGRKHQVRLHLSEAGFPVVGDRLYGNKQDQEDLQLTAVSLEFFCPVMKRRRQFLLPDGLMPTL